jgi:predicted P-loop ATPase
MARPPRPTLVPLPKWRSLLRTRGRAGDPIPDLHNTLLVLRNEPGFAVSFAFDEMQQVTVVRATPPLCHGASAGDQAYPRWATDDDVTKVQDWLQMVMPKLSRENVFNALEEFARSNPIHPLRLWLRTREITVRPPILENWLTSALGVPNDAYHREVGKRFAIAMVARVLDPGCQADYMIVLEGPQGEEKSKFCRALASDQYFSDHIPSLTGDHVRFSMHLRGKWLIEISELAAFNKVADVESLKALITRRVEIYTPKYGRKERHEPRQCVFIGTTNTDDWNRDETGGRRFWPVKVIHVDLAWLAEYRDQLFAEAVEAYDAGEPHWPDRNFERRVISPQQDKRLFHDAWEETLAVDLEWRSSITIGDAAQVIGIPRERLDMLAQKRLGAILRKLKWTKGFDAQGRKVWRKPE